MQKSSDIKSLIKFFFIFTFLIHTSLYAMSQENKSKFSNNNLLKNNYFSIQYYFSKINAPESNVTNKAFSSGQMLGDFYNNKMKNSGFLGGEFGHIFYPNNVYLNSILLGAKVWRSLNLSSEGQLAYKRLQPANNYNYKEDITATGLGIDVSVVFLKSAMFSPYASFEAGIVEIQSEGFGFSPVNNDSGTGDDPISLHFKGATKYNFYYKGELGVKYELNSNVSFGIGYFYSDLGYYSTGEGSVVTHSVSPIKSKLHVYGPSITGVFKF